MKYKLLERSEARRLVKYGKTPHGAEFFQGTDVSVGELMGYVYGHEQGIIDLDHFLYFSPLDKENLDFFRFAGGTYILIRYLKDENDS